VNKENIIVLAALTTAIQSASCSHPLSDLEQSSAVLGVSIKVGKLPNDHLSCGQGSTPLPALSLSNGESEGKKRRDISVGVW
jgi:hypothetical protein